MSLKAFDLHLLVGRENIMGNKPKVTIESLEMTGKNLYVGTSDGTLYHFLLLEDVAQRNLDSKNGTAPVSAFLQAQKRIMTKKAIIQIKAAAELKCLLINSDGLIQAYSMLDLTPSFAMLSRLKNVNRFYVNDHPIHANPFSVEICVSYSKKKNIQLYQVQEDNITPLKEISFPEPPISLALDGHYMCVGTSSGYFIFDIDTNTRQELLPAGENKLYVHRVAPAEFLLTGPNALGVFVTSAGISQRAPIQWSAGVFQACLVHPYVIAMDEDYITIHSVVDQQQKQTLPFQGGLFLLKNDDKLIVCTNKDVFILGLVAFEKQIADLLRSKKVQEAMDLAKECRKCMPRQQFHSLMQTTCRKAGFVHFRSLEFEEAEKMFDAGKIDMREIVSLYPAMLPRDSPFVRNVPSYHDIANVVEMCARFNESVEECFEFLASYIIRHPLESLPSVNSEDSSNPFAQMPLEETPGYRSDIFLSCVNVFAKLHMTENILRLLQGEHEPVSRSVPARSSLFYEFRQHSERIFQTLTQYQCFHARAVYSLLNDDLDSAMDTWKELALRKKIDVSFPGLNYVAEMLGCYCTDTNLLWKHAGWILDADQEIGVSIFSTFLPQYDEEMAPTENSGNVCCPKADDVINFLHRYPEPVVKYLEHLVFVRRIQKEKYHTHLAVLYLDHVLELKKENATNDEDLEAPRQKLQRILKESNMYRITLILGKVKDTDLYKESVILSGKLGEHEKALDILVNKLKDQSAAEEYCMEQSTDFESRKELFERLLSVYLSKVSAGSGKSSKSTMAVVDLLNKYAEYYDAQKVMNVLPKVWSIALLNQFLSRTMRLRMHKVHTSHLQQALERCENNSTRRQHIDLLNTSVRITEDKICEVCNRLFQDSDYVIYPNGVAVHPHCGSNKLVCPVTGQLFKTLPLPKH